MHPEAQEFIYEGTDSFKDPYQEAIAILVQGPSATPRIALQAYQSFDARWRVVKLRGLDKIVDAQTLAVILLLQYAYPDVFESVFNHPELLFYLYALVKEKEPNSVCQETEVEELRDLGLPAYINSKGKSEEEILILKRFWRKPDLNRLLGALPALPEGFDIDLLFTHLTLVRKGEEDKKTLAPVGVQIDPWEALTSGDPVLIKFSMRTHGDTAAMSSILLNHLIDLVDMFQPKPLHTPHDQSEMIGRVSRAIFALGRIGDKSFVQFIGEWLRNPVNLPKEILFRTIYALGHQATKPDAPNPEARRTLVELVGNKNAYTAARIRAARLLRFCNELSAEEIEKFLSFLRTKQRPKISIALRMTIKATVRDAQWRDRVLERLQPDKYNAEDVYEFSVNAKTWPTHIASYWKKIAHTEGGMGDRAFGLIENYRDLPQAMRWLAELIPHSIVRVAACLKKIGDIQRDESKWHSEIWDTLFHRLQQRRDESTWHQFIDSLRRTSKNEAAQMLGEQIFLYKKERRWREYVIQSLENMRDEGVSEAETQLGKLSGVEI